jgi:hypothetical protein
MSEKGEHPRHPCDGAFYHPEKSRDRYATPAEIEKLKKHADEQWKVIIDLMYKV